MRLAEWLQYIWFRLGYSLSYIVGGNRRVRCFGNIRIYRLEECAFLDIMQLWVILGLSRTSAHLWCCLPGWLSQAIYTSINYSWLQFSWEFDVGLCPGVIRHAKQYLVANKHQTPLRARGPISIITDWLQLTISLMLWLCLMADLHLFQYLLLWRRSFSIGTGILFQNCSGRGRLFFENWSSFVKFLRFSPISKANFGTLGLGHGTNMPLD